MLNSKRTTIPTSVQNGRNFVLILVCTLIMPLTKSLHASWQHRGAPEA